MENTPLSPEDYAKILQQSMAAALANVDAMQAEARKAHEAALDELAAARDTRKQIEADARNLAEQQVEKYYLEIKEKIREQTLREVTKALLNAGKTTGEIQQWLDLQPEFIEDVKMRLRSETAPTMPPWWFNLDEMDKHALNLAEARVSYKQSGRGGTVIFQAGDVTVHFDWEFGDGNAIALIFVPSADNWENATGLPRDSRAAVLDFVGRRVIADQGGTRYEVSGDVLEILK